MNIRAVLTSTSLIIVATVFALYCLRRRGANLSQRIPSLLELSVPLFLLGFALLTTAFPSLFAATLHHTTPADYAHLIRADGTETWILAPWWKPVSRILYTAVFIGIIWAAWNIVRAQDRKVNVFALGLGLLWIGLGVFANLHILPFSVEFNPSQAQEPDLQPYTNCDLGSEFHMVQLDGPVRDFAWRSSTKDGEVRIPVEVGYRVLVTYMEGELFGNLKVERLPESQYSDEKATLLKSLEFVAARHVNERNVQTDMRNGLTLYGTTQDKLEGGTLSIYNLFDDAKNIVVSMYLLNDYPEQRKFNTLDEYKKVRDKFLDAYTKCLAPSALGSRPGSGR